MNTEAGSTKGFFGGLFLTITSGLLLVAAAWWVLTILRNYPIALLVLSLLGLVAIFCYVGYVFFRSLRTEQVQEESLVSSPVESEPQSSGAANRGGESRGELNKMELVEETRGAVTTTQLVREVADKANASKSDAQKFVDAFTAVVQSELKAGNQIQINGFGKFYVQERDARQGANPQTKRRINISAPKVPKFIASDALKKFIK